MVFAISFLKNDKPKRQTLIAITQSLSEQTTKWHKINIYITYHIHSQEQREINMYIALHIYS